MMTGQRAITRVFHTLGALANLSVDETAVLIGGYPTAWSRIRALAKIACRFMEGGVLSVSNDSETDRIKPTIARLRRVINCHAGCTIDAICAAVALRAADLMPTVDKLPVNNVSATGIRRKKK